MEEREVYIK
jgi:recombination protein RecA